MKTLLKILVALIITSVTVKHIHAQNLVPNFSFEQKTACPTTADQVNLSTGWNKYSNNASTPDYYNTCSSPSLLGIPQSFFVYQSDNRNCDAYMGLLTWTSGLSNREHIGIQLSQPLIIGQKYFISFYTVMSGTAVVGTYYESPSNNIGLRFSTIPYNSTNPAPIDNFAHLRSVSIINDTANWVHISGSLVADSAYQYVILGNFYDNSNTDTTTLNCAECINNYSYYLVDDVCVSTDSTLCNGGVLSLPCNVSVEENSFKDQISIYPNPASNRLYLEHISAYNPSSIQVVDINGRLLIEKSYVNEIDISSIPSGIYFIKIQLDGNISHHKFIKN